MSWEKCAKYCEKVYGVYVDWEERFFHCPECEDVVYECDWEGHCFDFCPICEFAYLEGDRE